jgi:hypothetical protein
MIHPKADRPCPDQVQFGEPLVECSPFFFVPTKSQATN